MSPNRKSRDSNVISRADSCAGVGASQGKYFYVSQWG